MKNRRSHRGVRVGAVATAAATLASIGVLTAPVEAEGEAFRCDPGFYQVISGQLAELDPANERYETIGPDHSNYNALGYRQADGFLYGVAGTSLYKIDATGAQTKIATLDVVSGAYTGDFDDNGLLNVSRGGRNWYKVDVDTFEATAISEFSGYTAVADITNVHGTFYGVSSDGALYSYDQTSLQSREVGRIDGLPETLKAYGAAWSTAGGNLYVGRNSGEIYQITGYTTATPKATLVGRAPATNSNDGASCSLAPPAAGLDDVDGPVSESEPRTDEAKEANQNYNDNFDEISQTFTPAEPAPEPEPEPTPDDSTYTFEDSGLGTGPSCVPGGDEDRPERDLIDSLISVSSETSLYSNNFDGDSLVDFTILSGSWSDTNGTLEQHHICGYDYTVLLNDYFVSDFRWEANFSGITDTNQGGIIINQSSTRSRAGAMVIDLTDEGGTLRWGEYDSAGYYQFLDAVSIDAPNTGEVIKLSVEVHANEVFIMLNDQVVGRHWSEQVGGMVGLVSSLADVSFDGVALTALPPQPATQDSLGEAPSE